jgi:hypothetical protein
MQTKDLIQGWESSSWGVYNKCAAVRSTERHSITGEYKSTIYVFTGISPKRVSKRKYYKTIASNDLKDNYRDKVVFITNEQLMDMNHPLFDRFYTARALVFDGKFGTRYESKGSGWSASGSYFHCIQSKLHEIRPRGTR